MKTDFDILIVGSGPSGVHAAQEAVQYGAHVGMVDVGKTEENYAALTPDRPWHELRREDESQHRYFLGDALEGITNQKSGAQLTPARQFIVDGTTELLPIQSSSFEAIQSLAMGGLGAGWGAGCIQFEDQELDRIGLPLSDMPRWYEKVAREIGVSAPENDDLTPYIARFQEKQPPLEVDSNARSIQHSYLKKRARLNRNGFVLGLPSVAVLTRTKGYRKSNPYHDMDFWSDAKESVYRPSYTLRTLANEPNFHYIPNKLAVRFDEFDKGPVSLCVEDTRNGATHSFKAKKLLLAAGAINSARLVMKSSCAYGTRVPILSNPYSYIPSINLPMFGEKVSDRRHSLVQLSGIHIPSDDNLERIIVQFFSYRSLFLFKLARDMPLPPAAAMLFSRCIVNSLAIVAVSHPDQPDRNRWMSLKEMPNGRDQLVIEATRSRRERRLRRSREIAIIRNLASLRLAPLNLTQLPEGASIHYAGTLPFSASPKPLSTSINSRVHGYKNTYAVDGAGWNYLPAKGLTFTLMANARRIARNVANELHD